MRFKIENPDRGIWNVYDAHEYERAHDGADAIADRREIRAKLNNVLVASFKTRKAAREYVESVGGEY